MQSGVFAGGILIKAGGVIMLQVLFLKHLNINNNDYKQMQIQTNFEDYTYLEYMINPELFVKYLDSLQQQTRSMVMRDIFMLYCATLFEWINKDIVIPGEDIQNIIISKSRNRRMFVLLIIIAKHLQIDYQFYECLPKSREFIKLLVQSLSIQQPHKKHYYDLLFEYYHLLMIYRQMRAITKQEVLQTFIPVAQLCFENLFRIYPLVQKEGQWKKQICQLCYRIFGSLNAFSHLKGYVNYLKQFIHPEKMIEHQKIKFQSKSKMEIQSKKYAQPTFNLSPYYFKCTKKERQQYLHKTITTMLSELQQRSTRETKLISQLIISELNTFQQKINPFCNLLVVKIIQFAKKYAQQYGKQNQALLISFIDDNIISDFNDMIELATPAMKNVKNIIIAITFLSNLFQNNHYVKIQKFIGDILNHFKNQNSDSNFTISALMLVLFEMKIGREDIQIKIKSFWKYLIQNKQLIQFINSYDFLDQIVLLSFQTFSKKQGQAVVQTEFAKISFSEILNNQLTPKSKYPDIQLAICFSLSEIQSILIKSQKIVQQLFYDEELKILYENQITIKKLQILFLNKQYRLYVKNMAQFMSVYQYDKKQKFVLQTNISVLFKMLSVALCQINYLFYGLIAIQYCQNQIDITTIKRLLNQNKIKFNKQNIKYITSLKLLQILLKWYAQRREEIQIALIVQALNDENNYQFYSESRKKKNIFKKQVQINVISEEGRYIIDNNLHLTRYSQQSLLRVIKQKIIRFLGTQSVCYSIFGSRTYVGRLKQFSNLISITLETISARSFLFRITVIFNLDLLFRNIQLLFQSIYKNLFFHFNLIILMELSTVSIRQSFICYFYNDLIIKSLLYRLQEKMLSSAKVRSSTKKVSFLQRLFSDIENQGKATTRQKKLSNSFAHRKSQCDFKQTLSHLAHTALKKKEIGLGLFNDVNDFLKTSRQLDYHINSTMVKISYKKQTFDLMTPLKTITKELTDQINRSSNPLNKIIFEIWYQYIQRKYRQTKFPVDKFKTQLYLDLSLFSQFIANAIYYLFKDWFYCIQQNRQIYPFLEKQFVPNLLTSNKNWKNNYQIIMKALGQRSEKCKINKSMDLSYFDIDPHFSCYEMENPFKKSIKVIKDFYDEYSTKKKIKKLKELIVRLREEIHEYQEQRIQQQKQDSFKQIDVDNMVGCFTYCIFMSGRDGIAQSLDYLEIFYRDQTTDSSQHLQDLGIGHIMATLRSAAIYLSQEDLKNA